jgi:predicted NAD/FAD-binding protein
VPRRLFSAERIGIRRMQNPQKIAIIGAGISGLTAAHLLGPKFDVTLFEANSYAGGHTNTVNVQRNGQQFAVDTGFIVFNDRTYPNFIALLDELQVASRPSPMSFSVRCDDAGVEYCGSSLNGLFAWRRNLLRPSFYRMVRDILRFGREATRLAETFSATAAGGSAALRVLNGVSETSEMTVGEFLQRGGYSREFCRHYLLPMGSAIWSCPTGTFEQFPVRFVAEFYHNHGLLQIRNRPTWRVIEGGSQSYVREILRRFRGRILLSSPVVRVRRTAEFVEVSSVNEPPQRFDHVIFACHSDQALRMLEDPTPTEKELLSAFPYEKNSAVLHTDISVLPQRRRAWASWNYLLTDDNKSTVSYCMNLLQHFTCKDVFIVTLNSDHRIAPDQVLERFEYEHPIFTRQRATAQSRHAELIGVNRSSFCGAYWRNGFHEDGVVSAQAVCRHLCSARNQSTSNQLSQTP